MTRYRITSRRGLFRVESKIVSEEMSSAGPTIPFFDSDWRERLGQNFGSFADAQEALHSVQQLDAAQDEPWIEVTA